MQTEHSPFPSDETLAAYIDGRLDEETRERVVEHMAECEECFDVVMGAGEMGQLAPPSSANVVKFHTIGVAAVSTLATAAALTLVVMLTPLRQRIFPQQRDGFEVLVQAAPEFRNTEGRISGFPYRVRSVKRGSGDGDATELDLRLLTATAEVSERARQNPSASNLHALGIAQLLLNRSDKSVEVLEDAVKTQTHQNDVSSAIKVCTDSALLTDLAAAYDFAADRSLPSSRRYSAVEASERAWNLRRTPETAWNRALALEKLNMREKAIAAWSAYLALDSRSPWAGEAKQHLDDLRRPTDSDLWELEHDSVPDSTSSDLVRRFPQQTREYMQDVVFKRWANEAKQHRPVAIALLERFNRIAEDEAQLYGDKLLADELAAIRRPGAQVDDIVFAHLAFAEARSLYSKDHFGDAEALFLEAARHFRAASAPYERLAMAGLASCAYIRSDYELALSLARSQYDARDVTAYPAVTMQAHWVAGLADIQLGHPAEALQQYELAAADARRLQEAESIAGLDMLIAQTVDYLGRPQDAWKHRYEALRLIATVPRSRKVHHVYSEAASAAIREKAFAVAEVLLDELVKGETAVGNAVSVCSSLRWRSLVRNAAGKSMEADADLSAAMAFAGRIEEKPVRDEAVAAIRFAEGVELANRSPERALAAFEEAMRQSRHAGSYYQRAEIQSRDAEVRAAISPATALARIDQTLRDIDSRIDMMQNRDTASLPFINAPLLTLYDSAIDVAGRLGDWNRAFDYAERARYIARRMNEPGSAAATPIAVQTLMRQLPDQTAVLAITVTRRDVLTFAVTNRSVFANIRRNDASRLGAIAERLPQMIATDHLSDASEAAAVLYDELIAPHQQRLKGIQSLIVVPDGELWSVPFAFLHDRISKRFLVERYEITITSAASDAIQPREILARQPAVVAFADASSPMWPALAGARRETDLIRRTFSDARVFIGSRATKDTVAATCAGADLLHFGVHGAIDDGNPSASALLMTPSPAGGDGRLCVGEIRKLPLHRRPLIVLAACDSGVRREHHSKPDWSLADAFLSAGAAGVVSALWQIDDAESARLLHRFYAVLNNTRDPAAALRTVQAEEAGRGAAAATWACFSYISRVGKRIRKEAP